jgi:hypothetical protein
LVLRLSPEERRKVSRFIAEYYSTRRDHTGKREAGGKNLAAALKQRFGIAVDPSTVSRWETDLWRKGTLVEWADYNSLLRGTRISGDENDLVNAFDLKEGIVVNFDSYGDPPNDSELHFALANEAADEARDNNLYRDVRHLAVGSGRTMIRYAESIMNRPPKASDIYVSPISGRLWVGDLWNFPADSSGPLSLESPLDADFAALFIARGLHQAGRQGVKLSQISHFAYNKTPEHAEAVATTRAAFLTDGGWNWDLPAPDRIVFGAGSFSAPDHRITKFFQERSARGAVTKDVDQEVRPIFEKLAPLGADLKLAPIADVNLLLLPTLPLPEELDQYALDRTSYMQLKTSLHELNRLTLAIGLSHLQSVVRKGGFCQLIAGGIAKRRVVWTLLLPAIMSRVPRLINSLCTDDKTAALLVRAAEELKRNTAVSQRYAELIDVVFENR